jgi:hypothetical protein
MSKVGLEAPNLIHDDKAENARVASEAATAKVAAKEAAARLEAEEADPCRQQRKSKLSSAVGLCETWPSPN